MTSLNLDTALSVAQTTLAEGRAQGFAPLTAAVLDAGGLFTVYGPFRYDGAHTSDSNAAFDAALRAADPLRGVRDFEAVAALAREAGLELLEDRAMPAHNRCITWRRVAAA